MGEKRIDLAYPIQGKEVAIVRMLSDNVWYWIKEPVKVLLIMKEEKELLKGTFVGKELSTSLGGKLITTHWLLKTDKLAGIMGMVFSLDKLDNTDNLEDRRLSNILLRYHMTGYEEFTSFKPAMPQYKRLNTGSLLS